MKQIPFAMVIMTIVLPALLSVRPRPKQSMRLLYGLMGGWILIWCFLCLYVYTQYAFIE